MEPLKKDAIDIIANLPDDADMEEIMYRLHVRENIRRGQEDAPYLSKALESACIANTVTDSKTSHPRN